MLNLINEKTDLIEDYPLLSDLLIDSDEVNRDASGTWVIATDTAAISFSSNTVTVEQYGIIADGHLRGIPVDKPPLSVAVQALEMARVAVICQAIEASNSGV